MKRARSIALAPTMSTLVTYPTVTFGIVEILQ